MLLNLSSTKVDSVDKSTLEPAESIKQKRLKANWLIVGVLAFVVLGVFGSSMKFLEENAKQATPGRSKNSSFLGSLNPFAPPPPPTPQLSKEYVYAGSRLVAVEDKNANAAPPADIAVWRPSDGNWHVMGGPGSAQTTYNWGSPGDIPAQGDYDGDGKTDFVIYRPGSTGQFYLVYSSSGSTTSFNLGVTGDLPAPADYDGDGKTDIALYRPSDGSWYIHKSSTGTYFYPSLGVTGASVASADYDGDGLADPAVFSGGTFTARLSTTNSNQTVSLGSSGNTPVSSDYDGDGKADYAVFTGTSWTIKSSITGSSSTTNYGVSGDIPVHNDYDADGKTDIAVWRASSGTPQGYWYISQSTAGARTEAWGYLGDIPVPAYFRR